MDQLVFEDAQCEFNWEGGKQMRKVSWRGVPRKVVNVIRFIALGRTKYHSLAYIKRNRSFLLWEGPTEEEQAFTSRILTSRPLMRRACTLLESFCRLPGGECPTCSTGETACNTSSASSELQRWAADAIHQAKVCTARIAWRELCEYSESLRTEVKQTNKKYAALREQFHSMRADYLREVAALRDEVRARGNPEAGLTKQAKLDVTFFFDPMKALQPHEVDFALQVVSEKIKMIFEKDPRVEKMIDFGQMEKLKEDAVNNEVQKLREALGQKTHKLGEVQKECQVLQKRLDQRKGLDERGEKSRETQSMSASTQAMVDMLEDKLVSLREVQHRTQNALKDQYQLVEVLTSERDEAAAALSESTKMQAALRGALDGSRRELQELRNELRGTASREEEQLQRVQSLERQCRSLSETNQKLRRMLDRQRGRCQHCFAASDASERAPSPVLELRGRDSRARDSEVSISHTVEEAEEELERALASRDEATSRNSKLEAECHHLREAMQEQLHTMVTMNAQAQLQQAQAFEGIAHALHEDRDGIEGDMPRVSPKEQEPVDQLLEVGLSPLASPPSVGAANLHEDRRLLERRDTLDLSLSQTLDKLRDEVSKPETSVTAEQDVERADRIMKFEQRVTQLEKEKLSAEAMLAMQRIRQRQHELAALQLDPHGDSASQAVVDALNQDLNGLCGCVEQIAGVLTTMAEENLQMKETVTTVDGDVWHAAMALESSPALDSDPQLQRCLAQVRCAQNTTRRHTLQGVFGRLWNDSERRQSSQKNGVAAAGESQPQAEMPSAEVEVSPESTLPEAHITATWPLGEQFHELRESGLNRTLPPVIASDGSDREGRKVAAARPMPVYNMEFEPIGAPQNKITYRGRSAQIAKMRRRSEPGSVSTTTPSASPPPCPSETPSRSPSPRPSTSPSPSISRQLSPIPKPFLPSTAAAVNGQVASPPPRRPSTSPRPSRHMQRARQHSTPAVDTAAPSLVVPPPVASRTPGKRPRSALPGNRISTPI